MLQSISELNNLRKRVLNKISDQINDPKAFDAFFKETFIYTVEDNVMYVCCSSVLASKILQAKYLDLITSLVSSESNKNYKISFLSTDEKIEIGDSYFNTPSIQKKPAFFPNNRLEPQYNFENFVIGSSNEEAFKASSIVANKPGKFYNPLFIYSQSGLGKTHLLNAIGNSVLEFNPELKVLYCSSQDFIDEYIKFVNSDKNDENLKEYITSFDILLIDDIQLLQDKTKTEEFFFGIFEIFNKQGKQIVLTSDRLPIELKGLEQRLVTRFMRGLTVSIQPPTQELCENILRKKISCSELSDITFDDEVISFIASKFKNSVRNLEGALLRLSFYESMNPVEKIDMDFVQDALSSLIDVKTKKGKVTSQKILNTVSSYFNISTSQLVGKSKTTRIVTARHFAIYLIRNILDMPLKQIGDLFSGRDHATIIHSINKIELMLKTDAEAATIVNTLKKQISST